MKWINEFFSSIFYHAKRTEPFSPAEYSKLIVAVETLIRLGVIIFCCSMIKKTGDLTPFAYLIPMEEAVCGITYGYYFWKAKAENVVRMKQKYPEVDLSVIKEEEKDYVD